MQAEGYVPGHHTDKASFDPFLACLLNPCLVVLTFNLHRGSSCLLYLSLSRTVNQAIQKWFQ